MGEPSQLRDLARQVRDVARDHMAYSQVHELMRHVDEHLNALAYIEEVNREVGEEAKRMFKVDDRVMKNKGGYRAFGTVIGTGVTKDGKVLYMVEYDAVEGLVHIHSNSDLVHEVEEQRRG